MAERSAAGVRLFAIALLIANVALAAYIVFAADEHEGASARIAALQINPDRIKIVSAANRGPQGGSAALKRERNVPDPCLEWSPIGASDLSKAEDVLGRIGLSEKVTQRRLGDGAQRYALYIREADQNVVAHIAEIQKEFAGSELKAGACP
jgi:hypothetical protein